MALNASHHTPTYHGGLEMCSSDSPEHSGLCGRAVFYTIIATLTAAACIVKCSRLLAGFAVEKHHVAVFVLAALECILLAIHWAYVRSVVVHFVALYLLVNQFLVVCLFFGRLAATVAHKQPLLPTVFYPCATILFLYFLGALIYAAVDVKPNEVECLELPWLFFSASQFTLAQIFLLSGLLLNRAMNSVTHIDNTYLTKQKLQLWSAILAFELSAISNFSFDVALKLDPTPNHCDNALGSPNSAKYILLTGLQLIFGYLMPVWVLLYVLHPAPRKTEVRSSNLLKRAVDFEMDTTEDNGPSFYVSSGSSAPNSLNEPLISPTRHWSETHDKTPTGSTI